MVDQVVAWSPEALEDVNDIAAYIARDSAFFAAAVVKKMLVTAIGLNQFPDERGIKIKPVMTGRLCLLLMLMLYMWGITSSANV